MFSSADITALDTALSCVDSSIPVFIAQHLALHHGGRTTTNALVFDDGQQGTPMPSSFGAQSHDRRP